MLLAEITPAAPKINHDFLLKYWENLKNDGGYIMGTCSCIMQRFLVYKNDNF